MTLDKLLSNYNNDEETQSMVLYVLTKYVEEHKEESNGEYDKILKDIYVLINGRHFDKDFCNEQVREMSYEDECGDKHFGPFWIDDDILSLYEGVKKQIPKEYNVWDFYVTMHLMKVCNNNLLNSWFPDLSDKELTAKVTELSINWLNSTEKKDKDKVWRYFE